MTASGLAPTVPDASTPAAGEGAAGAAPARGVELGRFVVLRQLGAGGQGMVLVAYDPELDRKVALKLLHPRAADTEGRDRLIREAQAMARLSHPNVVTVHEVGTTEAQAFLVMELVDGRTLEQVLDEDPLDRRGVLALLAAAGNGLAAAHEAGLVHRDFKPGNVLVGADRRPRVTDFGLASAAGDAGAIAGTPHYMAPEQRRGDRVDARTDQYAFCVTARDALRGRALPAHVARALERGTADDPASRWPSMAELLAELRRDPGALRRRLALAAAALVVVAGAAFAMGKQGRAAAPMCRAGAAEIAGVWDDAQRERVRAAFAATGLGYAAETFERVDRALRARQAAWAAQHREACEATRVRGEQSEALLDLRMRCLGRARADLAALVDVLGRADPAFVDRSVSAALAAGDLDVCANADALAQVTPRPREPARAARADELEQALVTLRASAVAGRFAEARAAAPALIAAARELGWAPLTAEMLVIGGKLEIDSGEPARAEELLYEAHRVAEAGRDDVLAARTLGELVFLIGFKLDRLPEAHVLARLADAALARAGRPRALAAKLARDEGSMLQLEGKHAEALVRFRDALAALEAELGPDNPDLVGPLIDVGDALRELQRFDEARPIFARLVALSERGYGPDHPTTAVALSNTCNFLRDAGDLEAAAQACERAVAIRERNAPGSPTLAHALHNLAGVRELQGRLDEAREAYSRAIAFREKALGPKHLYLAQSLGGLASVARRQRRYDESRALAERALKIKLEAGGPDHPSVAHAHVQLGELAVLVGDRPEARAHYLEALRIRTKALGAEAPATLEVKLMLGDVELAAARPREALALIEPAEAGREERLGADHPDLVPGLLGLARARGLLGDAAGALDAVSHAARIIAAHDEGPFYRAMVDVERARALWVRDQGDDRAQAVTLAKAARAALEAGAEGNELADLDAWLARRR